MASGMRPFDRPEVLEDEAKMVVVREGAEQLQHVELVFFISFVQLSKHLQLSNSRLTPKTSMLNVLFKINIVSIKAFILLY